MVTIYLDNAATERVSPRTADFVREFFTEEYFNIGASYPQAVALSARVGEARGFLAGRMGARASELYFMSGATEANNLVLRGAARVKEKNVIITMGEHASVYATAQTLKAAFNVKFAPLKADGAADEEKLLALVDENTALVSVIHVSNETGAVNDIAKICRAVKSKNPSCFFHSDGVQAFAKLPVNVKDFGVDFYTVSGHKAGAPKGIAALYVREGVHLNPLISGGGQEKGLRAGTENVSGIMGFYHAVRDKTQIANAKLTVPYNDNASQFSILNSQFQKTRQSEKIKRLLSAGGLKIKFNGCGSPYITSVSIIGIKAETLSNMCAERGVVIGLGSACAASKEGNRVLSAMGLSRGEIDGNIRISLCNDTTDEEIETAAGAIIECARKLFKKEDIL